MLQERALAQGQAHRDRVRALAPFIAGSEDDGRPVRHALERERQRLGGLSALAPQTRPHGAGAAAAASRSGRTPSAPFVVRHVFAAFAVGSGGALERYAIVLAIFVAAFALGAAFVAWRGLLRGYTSDLLVVLYIFVPTAMLYAAVASNPKFDDRYLILVVPPFLLLLARGVVAVAELGLRWRRSRAALVLPVVAATLAVGLLVVSWREALRSCSLSSPSSFRSYFAVIVARNSV